jgi:glycosyltransferase involved in cell wall biosynthesis
MKLSVIVSVLNSHEIVRRQILYWEKTHIPDDVEIIYLDDGSNPPLEFNHNLKNFKIHPTNDIRPWTVAFSRNLGARLARGEYLLMTDIDYIITPEAIEAARNVKEDKMGFRRQFGVLDEYGNFTQDIKALKAYGLQREKVYLSPHPNNFVMRKDTFFAVGGYREDRMNEGYPKCTDDGGFKRRWSRKQDAGEVTIQNPDLRPTLYMFPSGQYCGDVDYNPFNLFHDLTRKTEGNYWYQNKRYA